MVRKILVATYLSVYNVYISLNLYLGYVDKLMEAIVQHRLEHPTHMEAKNDQILNAEFVPQPLTSTLVNKVTKDEAVEKHITRFKKFN